MMYNNFESKGGNMQIGAVSINNFTGKKKIGIEEFKRMDDYDLANLAYAQAKENKKVKNANRLSDTLWYSIPVVSAVSASMIGKNIPRIKRLSNTVKGFAYAAIPLLAVDLTYAGAKQLINKNEKARDFNRKHYVLSSVSTAAAAFGTMALAMFGAKKLSNINKLKLSKTNVGKLSEYLNNSKILNKMSEWTKKVPQWLGESAEIALQWAPLAMIIGSIASRQNANAIAGRVGAQNYQALKTIQTAINAYEQA